MWFSKKECSSAVLVSVLLVLMAITVSVTAFLAHMRVERIASGSFLNLTRARFVAQSGLSDAMHRLERTEATCLITSYLLEDVTGEMADPAPYLVALEMNADGTAFDRTNYLFSTIAAPEDDEDPFSAQSNLQHCDAAGTPSSTNWVDINTGQRFGTNGWIGLLDDEGRRRAMPVPWIYVTGQDGQVAGRYAFWIDDESAKVNLRVSGGAGGTHEHLDGATPEDISLHCILGTNTAQEVIAKRTQTGFSNLFFSLKTLRLISTNLTDSAWDSGRASLTLHSRADERGVIGTTTLLENGQPREFRGYRRLNINSFVGKATNLSTTSSRAAIVTNTLQMAAWITNGLPTFGQRYYTNCSSASDQWLYAVKIAANIHDYIDADRQPTAIVQGLTGWMEPDDTAQYAAPASPPDVFGKEVVPSLQDYAGFYYPDSSDANMVMDHTFEIRNIHSKPIDFSQLGTNINIVMRNRARIANDADTVTYNVAGAEGSTVPTLVIPVPSTRTIGAGEYALMTTLPETPEAGWGGGADLNTFARCVNGTPMPVRLSLTRADALFPYPGGSPNRFKFFGDTTASGDDCNTEVVFINEYGYLDIQARLAQQASAAGNNLNNNDPFDVVSTSPFGNDGTASGNNTHRCYPLDSGDPRSLTELRPTYDPAPGTYSPSATRRNTTQGTMTPPNATSFGEDSWNASGGYGIRSDNEIASSAHYVPEPCLNPCLGGLQGATNAVSVIRDGEMRSIGELGHIYDPALPSAGNYANDVFNRGGFRTLVIGTRVGETTGPSPILHVTDANKGSRLLDLFYADPGGYNLQGRININSVLRDPSNYALHALADQLRTQTNTSYEQRDNLGNVVFPSAMDPSMGAGALVNSANLVNALYNYATNGGVFKRMAEMAELDIFNTGQSLIPGVDLTPNSKNNNHLDRGREEIFRRIANLICLKGSVFSIHVIGETGVVKNKRFIVKGTTRLTALVETSRMYRSTDPLASLSKNQSIDSHISDLRENNSPTNTAARVLQIYYQ